MQPVPHGGVNAAIGPPVSRGLPTQPRWLQAKPYLDQLLVKPSPPFPACRPSRAVAPPVIPSFARLQRYNAAQVDLNRNWWDDSFPYGEQLCVMCTAFGARTAGSLVLAAPPYGPTRREGLGTSARVYSR